MKQGMGKSMMTGQKSEPGPKAISPAAVSRLGIMQAPGTTFKPLISGPGLKAPMVSQTSHPRGSQGKH